MTCSLPVWHITMIPTNGFGLKSCDHLSSEAGPSRCTAPIRAREHRTRTKRTYPRACIPARPRISISHEDTSLASSLIISYGTHGIQNRRRPKCSRACPNLTLARHSSTAPQPEPRLTQTPRENLPQNASAYLQYRSPLRRQASRKQCSPRLSCLTNIGGRPSEP